MQTGLRSEPHNAIPFLADIPNQPENTVRTVAIDREGDGSFRRGIESIERFTGGDPETSGPVPEEGLDKAPGRVVGVSWIATVGFELIAVVPSQRTEVLNHMKP